MRFARTSMCIAPAWGLPAIFVLTVNPVLAAGIAINTAGSNAVTRSTQPGLACTAGGSGAYRHLSAETAITPGTFSMLGGFLRTTIDSHFVDTPVQGQASAFLLGSESHATVSNARGSLQFVLRSGTCDTPTLAFEPATATLTAASTPWSSTTGDLIGNGAYRQATGSGNFALTAELHPGADNRWSLQLSGSVTVLQPALLVTVQSAHWDNLGLDDAARVVSVDYRIVNRGAGDAFGARFTQASSPTPGISVCGEPPQTLMRCPTSAPPEQALGDLANCATPNAPNNCDSAVVTVRYQLGLLSPCKLVVLGCEFDTTLSVALPDALDVPTQASATVHVTAPNLPPPAPPVTP